jgi:hypothetical protein
MLGTLLHSFNPRRAHTRQQNIPDSEVEETYTRSLLFPDSNALQLPLSLNVGSPNGALLSNGPYDGVPQELDLDPSRDIRIIVGQDESPSTQKEVLFDSKPASPRAESPMQSIPSKGGRSIGHGAATAGPTTPHHARRSSLFADPTSPTSPTISVFNRARSRGSSISSLPNLDQILSKSRETDELAKTCLDCMFGNTPMSYRGSANKLHIIPLENRATDTSGPVIVEARSSLPKGDGRKPSHLSKSFLPSDATSQTATESESLAKDRRRIILISRTFSINLSDESTSPIVGRTNKPSNNDLRNTTTSSTSGITSSGSPRRAMRKLPMFGVTIIIKMPVASMRPPSRPGNLSSFPQKLASHPGGSLYGCDSASSSLESEHKWSWSWVDSNPGFDHWLANSATSDVDERVDLIGKHWNIIARTLTTMQFVVQEKIARAIRAAEATYSLPILEPTGQIPQYRRLPGTYRNIRLDPHALSNDTELIKAATAASERIARGMKIPRVKLGQGRWGVWREEARWLGRWANGKEQNFFFFTLLTAFLGHHNEWIKTVANEKHKKLLRKQQKRKITEDFTISHRTIIVSTDKMAARRLIFLLSSFMPGSRPSLFDTMIQARPGTSTSARGYSQSPPSHLPLSRHQSLRRTINRRGRANQPNMRLITAGKSTGQSDFDHFHDKLDFPSHDLSEHATHSRRPSEAKSVQTFRALPALSDASNTGKCSTTTTSTVTPESAVPLTHFAIKRTPSFGPPDPHMVSSDSVAIDTLKRTSSNHNSHPSTDSSTSGRWGSFISFWSGGRQESVTDHSDILQNTDEGLGISGLGYQKAVDKQTSKLEQMVQELDSTKLPADEPGQLTEAGPAKNEASLSSIPSTAAINIPPRSKQSEPSLKLSVDEDGVIDVEIPGFGSPNGSPMLRHDHSSSSLEASSIGQSSVLSLPTVENDTPVNIAGWLGNNLHADFALQAVFPYPTLDEDVRHAMRSEPTPESALAAATSHNGPVDKWIDVSTTLIADTSTFAIKRIRYRRLVRIIPNPVQSVITPGLPPKRSQYGNPYTQDQFAPPAVASEIHLDEAFIEDRVVDMDPFLTDAVERVLIQSANSTRTNSASSSRSSSRRGRLDGRVGSDVHHLNSDDPRHDDQDLPPPPPKKECREIIYEALEQAYKATVREVHSEREMSNATDAQLHGIDNRYDSTLREGVRRWLSDLEETQRELLQAHSHVHH